MGPRAPLPTHQRLVELFAYDPGSGALVWKSRPDRQVQHDARWTGRPAGQRGTRGYFIVQVDGERRLAHRLIWKLVHGTEPVSIDHVNRDGFDNRLSNLRACTHFENMRNAAGWARKELPKGVHFRPESGRYRAIICVEHRNRSLGTFDTIEAAAAAYAVAAQELHGDFARTA